MGKVRDLKETVKDWVQEQLAEIGEDIEWFSLRREGGRKLVLSLARKGSKPATESWFVESERERCLELWDEGGMFAALSSSKPGTTKLALPEERRPKPAPDADEEEEFDKIFKVWAEVLPEIIDEVGESTQVPGNYLYQDNYQYRARQIWPAA